MRYQPILLLALGAICCGNAVELDPVNWATLGTMRALHGGDHEGRFYVAGDDAALLRFDSGEFGAIPIESSIDFTGLAAAGERMIAVGCAEGGTRGEIFMKNHAEPESEEWLPAQLTETPCIRAITRASGGFIAVGDAGLILSSRSGSDWQRVPSPTNATLYGVSASSNQSAFAVGEAGTMLKFDGTEWSELPKLVSADLYAVHVQSMNAAVAVGAGGEIVGYDGREWTKLSSNIQSPLYAVTSAMVRVHARDVARTRMLAAGAGGTVLAQDGREWVPVTAMTDRDLYTIWGPFAAGAEATILELVFHDVR